MNDYSAIIKELERAYDIPFVISRKYRYDDPVFIIKPRGYEDELFSLSFTIKQRTRLVIEFLPDKYSANMIFDMSLSGNDKRAAFMGYLNLLIKEKGATVDIRINDTNPVNGSDVEWPEKWNTFGCRITKSPITSDDEAFDPCKIVGEWAMICFGMFLSLLNIVPLEDEGDEKTQVFADGTQSQSLVTKYERNPINRQLCIAAHGCICNICGFSFDVYGDIGKGFIHVHHIEPVSKYDGPRMMDPVNDLIPVCPNCHAMLHRSDPPMKPDELKALLQK